MIIHKVLDVYNTKYLTQCGLTLDRHRDWPQCSVSDGPVNCTACILMKMEEDSLKGE